MPHVARAAVEALGYGVDLPSAPLWCGRPLYDYGVLDAARRRLEEVVRAPRRSS